MIRSFLVLTTAVLMLGACQPAAQKPAAQQGAGTSASDSGISVTGQQRPPLPTAQRTARDYLSPAVGAEKTVKVALLLPVTGRHADLGRSMQDAATLSLFDKYASISPNAARTRVELVPYDTGDSPEQARAAATKAAEDGVVLMVGPIFSDATQAIAPIAENARISVISFSNSVAVARPGVYLFGFSPEAQTRRVINYATTQGRNQLAALVPNSAYGQAVLEAARNEVTKEGGALINQSLYSAQGVGIEGAVDTIIPKGQVAAFDSLFIPEGGNALSTILRSVRNRGVQGASVQLLGTGLWDDPTLVSRVNLDGAWFASSPPQLTYAFESRFVNTYKYSPPRVASLAYDAVALAVTIVTSGRGFNQATLTNPVGFSGPANGIFRFKKDGTSERGLSVLQVRGGNFEVVSPAPPSFPQQH
jgi:branched-chain amino acid transport system substrate-binding protein